MKMIKYHPGLESVWNEFVARSKNGTFLFHRRYMDYHADRFEDFSLMAYDDRQRPVALLPASRHGDRLVSHGGLTYGGLIMGEELSAPEVLCVMDATLDVLRAEGMSALVYKCVPHIYHAVPAEEDAYGLFVKNARLIRRDISTVIDCAHPLPLEERRARALRKAERGGVQVKESGDFTLFWPILEANLAERYQLTPVHTAAEMDLLAGRFPDHIKFYGAWQEGELLAGAVVYLSACVCHIQYNASSPCGRQLGAQDAIIHRLIDTYGRNKRFIDFGVSTESDGRYLNAGLIAYKEGFGGRAVNYDHYELGVN